MAYTLQFGLYDIRLLFMDMKNLVDTKKCTNFALSESGMIPET